MTDFEGNSADYQESHFQGDQSQSQGGEQTRYLAQILLRHLPSWLEEEIRTNHLSILDWGCAEGEAVDSLRTHFPQSQVTGIDRSADAIQKARLKFGAEHFVSQDVLTAPLPVTFDVLATTHVLQGFRAPWLVLRKLGAHVARHLVVMVPYREPSLNGCYAFDDDTIGTRIDPDFVLSSCKVIGNGGGSQILLVYSRTQYVPQAGAEFWGTARAAAQLDAPPGAPVAEPAAPPLPQTAPASDDQTNPIDTIVLPALRQAESIAIVACAIPFSSALNQRPICCARYLADRGITVLFVELWQCPEQPVHRTGEEVHPGVLAIPFYAFQSGIEHTFQDNIDAIASVENGRKSYLCTLPSRELVDAARVLRKAGYHIHYDIMDDWEAFFEGDEEMTHWFSAPVEMEMIALADTVTAVSPKLVAKFQRLRDDIAEVRNGYQPAALASEQFSAARASVEGPRIVGYFGHFADAWFDWETLFYAAQHRPDLTFELIGYGLSDYSLLRLKAFRNIRFLGLVPQQELHRYAEKWWAAMIPFQTSTLSAAVDPLKVYEYLHFGLPAVVTGIPSVAHYPLVHLAVDGESFVAALDSLPARPADDDLAAVAEFLQACLWESRLAGMDLYSAPREDGAAREAALHSDLRYWQTKAAEMGKHLERQRRLLEAGQAEWQARTAEFTRRLDERALTETSLRARQQDLEQERETREADMAARHSALEAQLQYWQSKSANLGREVVDQRRQFQETERQFRDNEEGASAEIRALRSRASASEYEAASLRRLTSDLLNSWSWKVTSPLRFVTKPLFSAPAANAPAPETVTSPSAAPAPASIAATDPLEGLWTELRRAASIVILPSAVPFRSTFGQRPISCAKYFADHGAAVLYVAWQWSAGDEIPHEGQELYPRLFHLSLAAFQANLDRIAELGSNAGAKQPLYFCSLPTPALVDAARPLRAGGYHIHYDVMDDWEEFQRVGELPWYSLPAEREMVMLADTVSVVSEPLRAKFARLRSDILEVRNGYDPAALACRPFPTAHAPLEGPKTVGYFGHLSDGWFDWEALFEAARKLRDVQWELLGYGLSDRSRARLVGFANIRFSGLAAQSDLQRYARKWWAAMIPFRPSDLSAAVDPLKIYEYLHLGLPTVVTGVSGIADYPLVRFVGDRGAFVSAIEQVQARPGEQEMRETAEFLKSCTWEARLAKLSDAIGEPAGLASLYAR
jgi:glycosyltransferase involved in cell wall biosynthesis